MPCKPIKLKTKIVYRLIINLKVKIYTSVMNKIYVRYIYCEKAIYPVEE